MSIGAPPYTTRPTLIFKAKSMVPAPMFDAMVISIVAVMISLILFGLFVMATSLNFHDMYLFVSGQKAFRLCEFVTVNPLDVYQVMFEGSFGSEYSWGKTLLQAAPLMLTALCVLLPSRVGLVVIGGEGCVVLGGLMAALVAQLMPHSTHYVLLTSMILVGMATGGLWIMFAGALRLFRGVNEVISTLLLNYIAIKILNHCVEGPMHDPNMLDAPSSFAVSGNSQIPTIMGKIPFTDIHWGLAFGVIACILAWVLLERTTHGFATRIVGGNVRAARIAGLSVAKFSLIACFLGGAAAALAGVVEVAAVQGRANEGGLATNLGYTGILVAFVSRQNPLAVIPVAILMGGVVASGHDLKMHSELHIGDASVQVFTGILFLVILGLDTWAGRLSDVKNAWFARPFVRRFNRKQGVVHAGANA